MVSVLHPFLYLHSSLLKRLRLFLPLESRLCLWHLSTGSDGISRTWALWLWLFCSSVFITRACHVPASVLEDETCKDTWMQSWLCSVSQSKPQHTGKTQSRMAKPTYSCSKTCGWTPPCAVQIIRLPNNLRRKTKLL